MSSCFLNALFALAMIMATSPIVATSHVSLPFVKVINTTGSVNIIEKDMTRISTLRTRIVPGETFSEPIFNEISNYRASVGVGCPPTTYNLIVDTGSSNTWVGASTPYTVTSTSVKTSNTVSRSYGSGNFSGSEYLDAITIGSLVIKNQGIGVASNIFGFQGVDGILGLGPVGLTVGTLSPDTHQTIPTVTDTALSQGLIPSDVVAISFEPTTSEGSVNGELTLGGVDPSKFIDRVTYTPMTSTFPSSTHWGINQTIKYGHRIIQGNSAGIVDTGTTLQFISSDAFAKYKSATGATMDNTTGLLTITRSQYAKLHSLVFVIGESSFDLTPNAQIWPRALNTLMGGRADSIYLVVADIGTIDNPGFGFVNGQAFLERFYSVFDTTNKRVGFANTRFTTAHIN